MMDLPETWSITKLGDVFIRISNGCSAKQSKKGGDFPISRIETISNETVDLNRVRYVSNLTDKEIEKYSLMANDILFSHINSANHLGKTAIFRLPDLTLIHGINLLLLRPNPYLNASFINYQLNYLRAKGEFSKVAQHAVNQASINQKKLKAFDILIPPINEQQRIVDKIDTLFSDLDKAEEELLTVKRKLELYKQSLLKSAFEGKLTVQWRKENNPPPAEILLEEIKVERAAYYQKQLEEWKEKVNTWEANSKEGRKPAKPKKLKELPPLTGEELSGLPELPEGWVWTHLGQLKSFSIYGPRFSSKDYSTTGTIVLRTSDIDENGLVDTINSPKLPLSNYEYNKYKLNKGDLIITRTGSIGTIAMFNDDVKAIPGAFLIHYRLVSKKFSPYIFNFLTSPVAQMHLRDRIKGIGRPNLNVPSIEKLFIPFPSLKEQIKINLTISIKMNKVKSAKYFIDKKLESLDNLKQSILKNAFEGKLVKQCENDESASELLKKINDEN